MASESAGQEEDKDSGHRNHFRLLQEEGLSWSGMEPNTLFQNRGDGTFDEVGNVLGTYLRLDSRGVAAADLDGDGDLDLAVYNRNNPVIKIFRNDTPGQGNVLEVDLTGTDSGPMAIGAQAIASCGERSILRQVEVGSGFISQPPPRLHFGLGDCRNVETLTVRWPSGTEQILHDLPVNQRVEIVEDDDRFQSHPLRARNYNRQDLVPIAGELSAARPNLVFRRLEGEGELSLAAFDDETVVLNFWATWCTACVLEMPDLQALSRRFAGRVRFLGVSLDQEREDSEVLAYAHELGTTYEQVLGTIQDQAPFSSLGSSPPGAVPLTAVIHHGTVRAVFVGQIDVDTVAKLLETL
ncbi:MAG: ASPIC/UnbV domain-containing protein [Thermoanaerobaculia bacterium]|nr:ASPIC/UnbV domain-containing protein [Thermoanaerobaculia bacterium]